MEIIDYLPLIKIPNKREYTKEELNEFYDHVTELCNKYNVKIKMGD